MKHYMYSGYFIPILKKKNNIVYEAGLKKCLKL